MATSEISVLGSAEEEIAEMVNTKYKYYNFKNIRMHEKLTYQLVGGRRFKIPELCT